MSLLRLNLSGNPADDIAISQSGVRLAVLSNEGCEVYAMDMNKKPITVPKCLWRHTFSGSHVPRHVAFIGDERLYILTDSWDEPESCLWAFQGQEPVMKSPILEAGRISSLVPSVDHEKLYLQYQDGSLCEVETGEDSTASSLQTTLVFRSTLFGPEVKVAEIEGKVGVLTLGHSA